MVKSKKIEKRLIASAKSNSKRLHITKRLNGWAVRKEGNVKASQVFSLKSEAIELGNDLLASGKVSSVVVHDRTGKSKEFINAF